jgi:hypothetical protein
MKKILITIIGLILLGIPSLKADEGMWVLSLLNKNYEEMQKQGLKLTPEDIYSINQSSLKDAVVGFGGYCTGEIVSDQGLLFTNYHCGYFSVQQHSSLEHDYLKDGFWAESLEEELPTPGLFVDFLVRIEDVTNQILSKLNNEMTEAERRSAVNSESKILEKAATEGTTYHARVRSYFGGNEFYLLVYQRYDDVRLVGAPPSSIGRFGHETDNWVWPRHTADFCIFRVYTGPDGKAAAYSEDNIPMVPKHALPISLKGYEKGDFAMVLGYPGRTTRYMTSMELEQEIEINNKDVEKIGGTWLEIVEHDMKASDKVRIQYAAKQSLISNYWKMKIEQNKALAQLNVVEQKRETEDRFSQWVNADEDRKMYYGSALSIIDSACNERKEIFHAYLYYDLCMWGSEAMSFALQANDLFEKLKNKADEEAIQQAVQRLKESGDAFYKDYNPPTDLKTITALLRLYYDEVPAVYHPEIFNKIDGNYEQFTEKMFASSIFTSQEKFNHFLEKPRLRVLEKDPVFIAANSFGEVHAKLLPNMRKSREKLGKGNRLFIAGIREMDDSIYFYPDANSTMRLSYGTVGDYQPRDAVFYNYYTTMTGLMEKDTPGNMEFEVDDKLKELYRNKDFGRYGTGDNINICFTTNNDITGGSSGSPVLNGNGELIGLAFDGNSEAMSGDIAFDHDVQKCINADIRYVLFIIDKYAGAQRLIDEMNVVD